MRYDAVVVGGGHNGLTAAAYLARAGRSVLVLERLAHAGGAAVSSRAFPGVPVLLSRYSYLVGLLPDRIVDDLGLRVELRSRPTASYTPVSRGGRHVGLFVERDPGPATAASFRELTGGEAEYGQWRAFQSELGELARRLAPTMLEPLPDAASVRRRIGPRAWAWLVERPLGQALEARFDDDAVRGTALTDGLIGTFTHAHDPSLRQNRCFCYHVIGNGTGEWRVPVGGMGAVTDALILACRRGGVDIRTRAEVTAIESDGVEAEVRFASADGEHRVSTPYVLSAVAAGTLARLRSDPPSGPDPEGAQLKLNLVLARLPRLRSGTDPRVAFAGTLHAGEGYGELQAAYDQARAGQVPEHPPLEVYCQTLTDRSVLGPVPASQDWHTLTSFGLQLPARLFATGDPARDARAREDAVRRSLAVLNRHLEEPIEDCLATDADGRPCLEAKTPPDIEADIGLPGGHIFSGDLRWPWAESPEEVGTWGVETGTPNVLACGCGARRGGGVSGIGGHNAAHAVLDAARS